MPMLAERPSSRSVCKGTGPEQGHVALAAPGAAGTQQQQKSRALGKQGCGTEGLQVSLASSTIWLRMICRKVFLLVRCDSSTATKKRKL